MLPDLDQRPPSKVSIRTAGAGESERVYLGFASAVENIGAGPLVIRGFRDNLRSRDMEIVQAVRRSDGTRAAGRLPRATMRFVVSADHRHWHLLSFQRYELRHTDGSGAARDHKTGFCLGDRYRVARRVRGRPPQPIYRRRCGRDQPNLRGLETGISVGYGDDYARWLEGQEIDVTGLPSGRYVLVHRIDARLGIRERSPRNNAASVLLALGAPPAGPGAPRVAVLARCPDSATCPPR